MSCHVSRRFDSIDRDLRPQKHVPAVPVTHPLPCVVKTLHPYVRRESQSNHALLVYSVLFGLRLCYLVAFEIAFFV